MIIRICLDSWSQLCFGAASCMFRDSSVPHTGRNDSRTQNSPKISFPIPEAFSPPKHCAGLPTSPLSWQITGCFPDIPLVLPEPSHCWDLDSQVWLHTQWLLLCALTYLEVKPCPSCFEWKTGGSHIVCPEPQSAQHGLQSLSHRVIES